MTLPTQDIAKAGLIWSSLPITSYSSLSSVSSSSSEYVILLLATLAYARQRLPASANKAMLLFISLSSVHGESESCPAFQLGGTIVSNSGSVRVPLATVAHWNTHRSSPRRLPSLADDSRTQALLSNAGLLLVSTTHRARVKTREAAQRLQSTICTPRCHSLARRVSGYLYVCVLGRPSLKVELWDQPHAHWKRSIHIHGYSRRFPGNCTSVQVSSLGALRERLLRYIYWGLDVSVLLVFLYYRPFCLRLGISVTTSTSLSSGLCTMTLI